jgi:hypothetical protein
MSATSRTIAGAIEVCMEKMETVDGRHKLRLVGKDFS